MFRRPVALRWLSILLCLSIGATSLPAQVPQEPIPTLTIRVSSRLALVDVVVTDKRGQPVPGLTSVDFTITEKGKPQKIAVFTAPGQSATPAAPPLPAGVYSNRAAYRSPGLSRTVILLYAVNTPL